MSAVPKTPTVARVGSVTPLGKTQWVERRASRLAVAFSLSQQDALAEAEKDYWAFRGVGGLCDQCENTFFCSRPGCVPLTPQPPSAAAAGATASRWIWRAALLLAALLTAGTVLAQPTGQHLVLHGLSYHLHQRPSGKAWNELNAGVGLRQDWGNGLSTQAGLYRNSIDRSSLYGLVDYTPLALGPLRLGGFAGLATGYSSELRVVGGGVVRLQGERVSLTLRAIPKVSGNKSASTALELGWSF